MSTAKAALEFAREQLYSLESALAAEYDKMAFSKAALELEAAIGQEILKKDVSLAAKADHIAGYCAADGSRDSEQLLTLYRRMVVDPEYAIAMMESWGNEPKDRSEADDDSRR